MLSGSLLFALFVFIVVVILIIRTIRVVPQQRAWVLERLGRFHSVLQPGLNFVVPFLDRVAYKHDLREIPLDVGQSVEVQIWHPDGKARVTYRGTQWDAELARPGAPKERTMYIVGTRGSTLLLDAERA